MSSAYWFILSFACGFLAITFAMYGGITLSGEWLRKKEFFKYWASDYDASDNVHSGWDMENLPRDLK